MDAIVFPSMLFGMTGVLLYSLFWSIFKIYLAELLHLSLMIEIAAMSYKLKDISNKLMVKTLFVFNSVSCFCMALMLVFFYILDGRFKTLPFIAYSFASFFVVVFIYIYLKKNNRC